MKMKILFLVTILVASIEASKREEHCKCHFSLTENQGQVRYYENHCKYGYEPSSHLIEQPSIGLGVTIIHCNCGCKIKKEFAQLAKRAKQIYNYSSFFERQR